MPKKLSMMINRDHPEVCRAVILEDGKINDYIVENVSQEKIKGNIYLGVINRVEPAIEAAFVNFGGTKYGFLPFKDVLKESYVDTGEKKSHVRIQDVLVRGQEILVQVAKESRDAKGPSLTNSISLPGRFLVLMSGSHASAVSRKIEDGEERKNLKTLVADFELPKNLGLIIRTAGVGRTKTELQKDLNRLLMVWENLTTSQEKSVQKAPYLLYQEADMVVRLVRDNFTTETSEVLVDNVESYKAVKSFMRMVMPKLENRVKLYQDTQPIFSRFKIEDQIESLYQRKVLLPAGGSIVFDSGEAMVSIDVNSGKTTSASQLEETALNTNLEAAIEIGRQLRLRDLGGLVVIDFIDMFHKKNQGLVEKELKKICKLDKARINMARISKFGLLEMSRQRLAPPVQQGAFIACSSCSGTGVVRSLNYIVVHVLRKINEHLASGKVKKIKVEVSPDVIEYMLNKKVKFLLNLQEKLQFELEFISRTAISWVDFKYFVTEKTEEEIKNLGSSITSITGQVKVNGGENSKHRNSRRPVNQTHRRTYKNDKPEDIQSGTIEMTSQSNVINEEVKQQQDSKAPETQVRRSRPLEIKNQSKVVNDETKQQEVNQVPKTQVRRGRPPQRSRYVRRNNGPRPDRKNVSGNTRLNESSSVKPPSQSSIVIDTQNKISSPNNDSVTKGESKNLFKRMTGFFGKVIKNEDPPPSGPKS
jgi:ribonuclease E